MNLKKEQNSVISPIQNQVIDSFGTEKTEKPKFDFIKKKENSSAQIKEENNRSTFNFINKANKLDDIPVTEKTLNLSSYGTGLNLEFSAINSNTPVNDGAIQHNETVTNEEKKPTKFSFIKKVPESSAESMDMKKKNDTNTIINNIYNTSLNFDKQSVKTIDLQNNKNFEDNLINELNNSETKSYKSLNPNPVNNIISNEVNVSSVENTDNETCNINFQNLLNSDNFGQTINKEENIFKDIQPSSKFSFFSKQKPEDKKENPVSFFKKKEPEFIVQTNELISNSSIYQNNITPDNAAAISEGKDIIRKSSDDIVKTPKLLKNKCKEEFNRCEENLKDLYQKMHRLKKRGFEKESKLRSLNNDMEAMQIKENIAIENNDFDEAQRIENVLEGVKDELKTIKNLIKDDNDEMVRFREQEIFLINMKIRNSEDVITNLGKIKVISLIKC